MLRLTQQQMAELIGGLDFDIFVDHQGRFCAN
jgi:hypothetical protein